MKSIAAVVLRLVVTACLLAATSVGCRTLNEDATDHALRELNSPTLGGPQPPAVHPPRELNKVSLPAYRIEPPDVIQVEMLKLVPLPPYRVETFDVVQIVVIGTLLDAPIQGPYLVEADGNVNLGPPYGKVRVVGMTIEEATNEVTNFLRRELKNPEVSFQLLQSSGTQPVTGQYLVGPDGTVNLRQYGKLHVSGLTITEAELTLQRHLSQWFDSPDVAIDVIGYNSKVFYIITEGAGQGDNVIRVPITGNETVLDAISQVGGLSQLSSKQIWIARPAPAEMACEQILPIDWESITRGGGTGTNYQVLPGDRIFIAEDEVLALTNFLAKVTGPVERVIGFASLGASTVRNFQFIGQQGGAGAGFGF